MSTLYFLSGLIIPMVDTSISFPMKNIFVSNAKLPTDPVYTSDISLNNIAIGSSYLILALNSELELQVLASGIAAENNLILHDVPSYSENMLIEIRVRNSSNINRYKPLITYTYSNRSGSTVYISQEEDTIAELI